uniref:Triple gene block protein 2 n=1 Tax=Desert rose mottle virus TaxID=3074535 RepID=A0AA51WCR0_9VIRU|nr:triple gene block protein 2 [Desert rose mottle virus]
MPLTPPPNHIRELTPFLLGFALVLAIFTCTRNTLPHTGDNIHSLPFGGSYVDGTKRINYLPPKGQGTFFPSHAQRTHLPAILVCILPLVIFLLHKATTRNNPGHTCTTCSSQTL